VDEYYPKNALAALLVFSSSQLSKIMAILKNASKFSMGTFLLIAGPCAVESREQLEQTAKFLKDLGISYMRGGIYKTRTSPYSFQGLGEQGIFLMKEVCQKYNLRSVSEVIDKETVEKMKDYIDVLQVGSRNMQNVSLLRALGKTDNSILLKRGFMSTLNEWLFSGEYISKQGNDNIIFCERGIRTFQQETRYTLDLGIIPAFKKRTEYPIIVDPSHSAGKSEYVQSLALAAVAANADGLIIEIHPEPEKALSDKEQLLNFSQFEQLFLKITKITNLLGKTIV